MIRLPQIKYSVRVKDGYDKFIFLEKGDYELDRETPMGWLVFTDRSLNARAIINYTEGVRL